MTAAEDHPEVAAFEVPRVGVRCSAKYCISPWDLLIRRYLPSAGLEIRMASTYPPAGFVAGRPAYSRIIRLAQHVLAGRPRLLGDNHVLVLSRIPH